MPQLTDATRAHHREALRLAELERLRAEAEAEAARLRDELDRLNQPTYDPYADNYSSYDSGGYDF